VSSEQPPARVRRTLTFHGGHKGEGAEEEVVEEEEEEEEEHNDDEAEEAGHEGPARDVTTLNRRARVSLGVGRIRSARFRLP